MPEISYPDGTIHRVNLVMDDGTEESMGFESHASARQFLERCLDRIRSGSAKYKSVKFIDGGKSK